MKIGYRYPKTLVPVFDHLRSTIVEEFQYGGLQKMEYVTLVEALVLVRLYKTKRSTADVQKSDKFGIKTATKRPVFRHLYGAKCSIMG